jgi:hypothetical protein
MRNLSRVYHVGDMDTENPAVYRAAGSSYEGNGLSVSAHPEAWKRIARLGGGSTYALTKENPRFFDAYDQGLKKEAVDWCLANGFLEKRTYWQAMSRGGGVNTFSLHDTREEAEKEADSPDFVCEHEGFAVVGPMLGYFRKEQKPSRSLVEEYAIIWFAEAAGFDGVWWSDSLSPNNYSAPRGVIFQHMLDSWTIVKNLEED